MLAETFYNIETLDYLIRTKNTGTSKVLAKRLGVSPRTLFGILSLMRQFGAPITYCRKCKCYQYNESGEINLRFKKFDPRSPEISRRD